LTFSFVGVTIRKRKAKVKRSTGFPGEDRDSTSCRDGGYIGQREPGESCEQCNAVLAGRPDTISPLRIPFPIPARRDKPFDVAGLGLNSIDLVAVVADYPTRNTKQQLRRFTRLPGGQTATAMVACARLGWRARYIGSFGDDDLGAMARQTLVREGVDITASRTMTGATNQFAIVLVDARTGERTVLWDRHRALRMDPSMVPAEAVVSGRMLVVDCHETAAASHAAALARQAGVTTVLDVEKVRPGIDGLLRHIDAIIAAEPFPCELTGYEQPGRALEAIAGEYAAPLTCVTLGREGSLAWAGGREIRTPAFPVDCVDSTGAGDAFHGGFVAGCLRDPNAPLEDVLSYANAVAGLNCRVLGAQGGLPTAKEVEDLLISTRSERSSG
jgi:sulfofructose kinase